MSLIERTLEKLGYTKKSADAEYTLDELFSLNVIAPSKLPFRNQKEQLSAYVDWVYAAASAIAQDAATIDLRAYANRSGKPNSKVAKQLVYYPSQARSLMNQFVGAKRALEELDDHIVLELLENPNPIQDGDVFKEMTFLHLILAGEAFWVKLKNGLGRPAELWPVLPYLMKEKVENRRIVSWEYRVGAESIHLDPLEVVHLKLTDPTYIYRGLGVVKAAARAIDTDSKAADWNRTFFKNSARPDLALETDSTLTTEVVERLREQWQDRYNGTDNAHKVAVLEAGLKVNKITATQKEMDFLKSRQFSRDEQLAMFKTSRTMLGIVEGDGRSNMEAAEYNQAKRVIRPLMRRFVSGINHSLAKDFDTKLVIGFTDPVPEDKEFQLKERIESINSYRTINEIREEAGLEPVPHGDVIYQREGMVPLGTVVTAPAEAPADEDAEQGGKKSHPKPGNS